MLVGIDIFFDKLRCTIPARESGIDRLRHLSTNNSYNGMIQVALSSRIKMELKSKCCADSG